MGTLAGSAQATFCRTVVDEWARAGVRHAVVCPGSRSTPLALALAADSRLAVHVHLDERSAGFLALGIGMASGHPAVLLTTSGTAAAEVHAAVVEAHQARVPLLVCTADRPGELHHVGAPQTIEQVGLYGGAVRFAVDVGVPDEAAAGSWRSLGARLVAESVASPLGPGPVQMNVAFRDPLDAEGGEPPPGRESGVPWHGVVPPRRVVAGPLSGLLGPARRPLLVVGARGGSPQAVLELAARSGWPVLADPRSGCRDRSAGPGATVVAAADSLLRVPAFATAHRPDLVVRLGESWASKVVSGFLAEAAAGGATGLLADPFSEWRDPGREVGTVLRADPDEVVEALACLPPADPAWSASWAAAEMAAQAAISDFLDERFREGELTEPFVARRLAGTAGRSTLVVSSSMPVRDLEWFAAPAAGFPRVLANRGANGIDGVVSTTLGVALSEAAAGRGGVVGLVGDLAFLHDLTALLQGGAGSPLAAAGLVVVDNAGGGIFSHLPQARTLPEPTFERLFATPQAADPLALARAAGWEASEATSPSDLDALLPGLLETVAAGRPAVLVCRTDRRRSAAVHDGLVRAVEAALSGT